MSDKILYIFVEGPDDEKFIKTFILGKECLKEYYKTINCVCYSKGWTANKIKKYIRDVIVAQGHDYIFLADADFEGEIDCFPLRKEKLVETYELPDINRVWIVIKEIESWFLAGFDEAFCKKEKLEFKQNTESVTKEIFDKIDKTKKKSHIQLIDFLIKKSSDFSFVEVTKRNKSLARFHDHFGLVC